MRENKLKKKKEKTKYVKSDCKQRNLSSVNRAILSSESNPKFEKNEEVQ